jgi:F0F1-type ATP synthase membrane subunit b/b'
VWFIFPTLLLAVTVLILIMYRRLETRYRSLEARYRELSRRYEEVAKQYEEAKRALEAAQRTISAHVEERDAARRHAAQRIKEAELRAREAEAEAGRLKKALEEKERELASTKARLEEELQACVQSLNYLRGQYAELKPEEPLWARAVDTHIAAQLPPRDIYGILIEVPYVDLDREIMRRRKIEQLLLEKYGIAKLPPLRIATETNVVAIGKSRMAKFKIPYPPPAVYIANYNLLVWRPRPSLHTIYSNIDKYLNES